MINIIIGMLIWQAIITLLYILGKRDRWIVVVGCGVWFLLFSAITSVIKYFKQKGCFIMTKLTYVVKGKGFSVEVKTLAEAKKMVAEIGGTFTPKYTQTKLN